MVRPIPMDLTTPALRIMLALHCGEKSNTTALASKVGISQQSVSRIISELASDGLVEKRNGPAGLCVCITRDGWRKLSELHDAVGQALDDKGPVLKGTVETGIGEGRYYISRPEYAARLTELLGKEPYAGTLNVHVGLIEKERFLISIPLTEVPGFSSHGRTYGAVQFYPVTVQGRDCGLIIPTRRGHGPEKVELVAPFNMRQALQLHDGDEIVIERRS